METIYGTAVEAAKNGHNVTIDLVRKSLRIDRRTIVKEGRTDLPAGLPEEETESTEKVLQTIESLYQQYRHSIPSERSAGRRKNWFKALDESELDADDMLYGAYREPARVKLEAFVLLASITGRLTWNRETMGENWFWQSKKHPDLVILKNWVA